MNKEQLKLIMQKYLDGKASPREKRMIEAWILLSEKEEASIPDREKETVKTRIWMRIKPNGIDLVKHKPVYLRISNRWLRYAAIWLVLIGLCTAAFLFRGAILDKLDPIAQQFRQTGPYETMRLLLPDSSVVTLAANSSISYPAQYRGSKRYARLNGKAFFSVTQDPSSPFILQSNEMNVKVLGTSFEVNNTEKENEAIVTVVTGKVQVSSGDQPIAVLTPDQRVTYRKKNRTAVIEQNIDAVALTSWTNNRLVFDETPLSVVWHVIAAGYGVRIEPGKKALLAGGNFSGKFTRSESLKDVLDVVCASSGLSWSLTNDHAILIGN